MKPTVSQVIHHQFDAKALGTDAPQPSGRQEILTVIHVVLAHDRHWRQHARRPILVRDHPTSAGESCVDESIEDLGVLIAGQSAGKLAGSFRQIQDPPAFDNRIEKSDANRRIVGGRFHHIEVTGAEDKIFQ